MVLFSALTFVSLHEEGLAVLRLPLLQPRSRHHDPCSAFCHRGARSCGRLVNQPPITLFMATLGLSYIIEGGAQLIWGTQVHGLDLGIEDVPPLRSAGVLISKVRPVLRRRRGGDGGGADRCVVPAIPAAGLAFGRRPRTSTRRSASGCGCRASGPIGLGDGGLRRTWLPACSGARARACSSRCLSSVLKSLPVLVLGGFDSIAAAPSSAASSSALTREPWPRSIIGRYRRRRHRPAGSLMSPRSHFCWCGRRACSARSSVERV